MKHSDALSKVTLLQFILLSNSSPICYSTNLSLECHDVSKKCAVFTISRCIIVTSRQFPRPRLSSPITARAVRIMFSIKIYFQFNKNYTILHQVQNEGRLVSYAFKHFESRTQQAFGKFRFYTSIFLFLKTLNLAWKHSSVNPNDMS